MADKIHPIYNIEDFSPHGAEKDFYTNFISAHLSKYGFVALPHKHDFFFSVFVSKGRGTHMIDFNTYSFQPGDVFMISPGQVHSFEVEEEIEGYIIFHTREFYDVNFTSESVGNYPFYCSIYNTPLIRLASAYAEKIKAYYEEILNEHTKGEMMKQQKLRALINILYIELSRQYIPDQKIMTQNVSSLKRVRELEELIEKNYHSVKKPREYAGMMFQTEKNLNRICKICLDKTVTDLIFDRIVLEAKRMLIRSEGSIAYTAERLGYADTSYFSRIFKKRTGMTPLEFVNQQSVRASGSKHSIL